MARQLIAMLPEPGEAWRFAELTDGGVAFGRSQERPSRLDNVTVLVPGTEVAISRSRLVGNRRADWIRAARFAVEDDVSVAIETLHAAVGQRRGSSELADVCLVARDLMDHWLRQLDEAGLPDARLVPDTTILPAGVAPMDIGSRILVADEDRRFAIDKSLPDELVSALISRASGEPERPDDPLLALARYVAAGEAGVDLRQAEYVRKAEMPVALGRLRVAGILAAACALVWGVYTFASIQTMHRLEDALTRQTRATFTALYPGEPVPANILNAVRDRSGSPAQVVPSFREMSGVLYAALASNTSTSLSSLRYDAGTGQLQAKVTYSAFGDDQALKSAIEAGGLAVRLGDARVEDGRVVGDLILELPS